MTHGRKFQVVNAGSVQPNQRNRIRRGKNLSDRGSPGGTTLNYLARGAGKIAFGSGRLLNRRIVYSEPMLRRRHLTVPVEHGDSQQVYL